MRQWYSDAYTAGFNKGYEKGKKEAQTERKKGKWGADGECPFCGYLSQWDDDHFCANCGADMRGEQDGRDS